MVVFPCDYSDCRPYLVVITMTVLVVCDIITYGGCSLLAVHDYSDFVRVVCDDNCCVWFIISDY